MEAVNSHVSQGKKVLIMPKAFESEAIPEFRENPEVIETPPPHPEMKATAKGVTIRNPGGGGLGFF